MLADKMAEFSERKAKIISHIYTSTKHGATFSDLKRALVPKEIKYDEQLARDLKRMVKEGSLIKGENGEYRISIDYKFHSLKLTHIDALRSYPADNILQFPHYLPSAIYGLDRRCLSSEERERIESLCGEIQKTIDEIYESKRTKYIELARKKCNDLLSDAEKVIKDFFERHFHWIADMLIVMGARGVLLNLQRTQEYGALSEQQRRMIDDKIKKLEKNIAKYRPMGLTLVCRAGDLVVRW